MAFITDVVFQPHHQSMQLSRLFRFYFFINMGGTFEGFRFEYFKESIQIAIAFNPVKKKPHLLNASGFSRCKLLLEFMNRLTVVVIRLVVGNGISASSH